MTCRYGEALDLCRQESEKLCTALTQTLTYQLTSQDFRNKVDSIIHNASTQLTDRYVLKTTYYQHLYQLTFQQLDDLLKENIWPHVCIAWHQLIEQCPYRTDINDPQSPQSPQHDNGMLTFSSIGYGPDWSLLEPCNNSQLINTPSNGNVRESIMSQALGFTRPHIISSGACILVTGLMVGAGLFVKACWDRSASNQAFIQAFHLKVIPGVLNRIQKEIWETSTERLISRLSHKYEKRMWSSDEPKCEYVSIPEEFECPITMRIIDDPVIAPDGFTYERWAIESWLLRHKTSPMTNEPLEPNAELVPNQKLKESIQSYLENNTIKSTPK
eukprot:NODE_2911_length_1461_cov_36.865471_g2518_i0.p1 GENE.NODE_2911_length_1461_cov_36.865471_g2518_i0~~NODE_2911_length_1461_cov_36.865471_g2518_i0.p1  ORF type:complete len:329 (+),score=65.97 NODE_2911_length_1461_cov_36.865471_g2518_i0:77-1063(+)